MNMILRTPAKVNLFLQIVGKRDDGYHLLQSLVWKSNFLYDEILIKPSDRLELKVTGKYANLTGSVEDNIILRAIRLFSEEARIALPKLELTLNKKVPVGAGLGGGSSNAAFMLRFLDEYYDCGLVNFEFKNMAQELGADVSLFIRDNHCYMTGVGNLISPLRQLPELCLLLVYPRFSLSTIDVYKNNSKEFSKKVEKKYKFNDARELVDYLSSAGNDLEDAAFKLTPQLQEVIANIKAQQGCLLARMTGSGSCCFGIFEDKVMLANAREALGDVYDVF